MTRRQILFNEQTIQHVYGFYDFHNDRFGRMQFDEIVGAKYLPKLTSHSRGFSEVIPPFEATLSDFEEILGRTTWASFSGDTISVVQPDCNCFLHCSKDVIVYENESCLVRAYEKDRNHLHVLLATAKSSSLGTFKRFKRLIREMQSDYDLITARIADKPCKVVGLKDDWRFVRYSGHETRLIVYWRHLGFKPIDKDQYNVGIKSTDFDH